MSNVKKMLDKLKHPNSRKTQSLAKKMKKSDKKGQNKFGTQIKQSLIGEKLLWFKDRLPDEPVMTTDQIRDLVEVYLSRFDEELDQITLKNSVGHRKNRQHASREDILKMTKKREEQEFSSCGLEIPDLMDQQQMEVLRNWNGELKYLQNFKLRRFSRKHLI